MQFYLDDVSCDIHYFGGIGDKTNVTLFIMPVVCEVPDLIEGQHMRLDSIIEAEARPHVLVTFITRNWNDDLSPWAAPALRRDEEDFKGRAQETLDWIENNLIPSVEARVPSVRNGDKGLLGYSMAGLFALWAATKTDTFNILCSCSGSLWYDGFVEYFTSNTPQATCSVYLSLGDKEELARNRYFAKVGNATRQIAAHLKTLPMVKETTLVWNPGQHTGTVGERLAKAQLWMRSVCRWRE